MVCKPCWYRGVVVCPTCRGHLDFTRCLGVDNAVAALRLPCRCAFSGSGRRLAPIDKPGHGDLPTYCEFFPCTLRSPGHCRWQNRLDDLVPPLAGQHRFMLSQQGEQVQFLAKYIAICYDAIWVMIQSCFGFHFLQYLQKDLYHEQFSAVAILIGTPQQAEGFTYRFALIGQRRRLTWDATPMSLQEGMVVAISNRNHFQIDSGTAMKFAEDGDLNINVTIAPWPPKD
uniref:E3 ubiquitin-protein ligase Siah1-like n=1 Tax=Myxine glutinosa TaxID=7769 RepID=UPI00358E655C